MTALTGHPPPPIKLSRAERDALHEYATMHLCVICATGDFPMIPKEIIKLLEDTTSYDGQY